MAQNLSGGKLIILKNDGITERIAYLPKNKRVINVGSDITCDIRLYLPEIRQFHFKITPDQIGKPKVSNLSVQNPITVNDEIVTTKRILKSGDVIGVLGKKFRWENKLDAKRKSAESLPGVKKSRKSIYTNCIATQRRITILSICQSEKKKYTDAVFEHTEHELQSNQLKKKLDKSNPLTTPTREIAKSSPLKKNNTSTPKTPKLDFLNRSETLITSYSVSKSFSTPTKSCMSSKISTPDSKNKHYNCSTPSKINLLKTPQNVLAEKSHNLIELHSTPVHGQKKSMHLIDLTTPFIKNSRQFTPKHVTSTPKLTEKNNVSTRKDNTLLKSAIKNSTVKKRWAVNGRSITLPSSTTKSDVKANSSTIAESPLYTSCRDSSSVIEVNETLDDTFETIPPSLNTECIEDTETISMVLSSQETNDTANSPGISNMLKFTQYQKTETRDVSGIIELVKTPTTHTSKVLNVILKTPKNLNEIMETSRNISSINAEQSDSDEDGVKELLSSISSVLEDSNEITKNETRSSEELPSNSIKFIPNEELSTDNPEFVVSEKVVSSIDVVPNNFIEPELKTMDRTFDELIGIPTITKTYNRKSSAFIQEKIDDESANEMKLKEKECGERVIKWIEDVKASGSLECNNKSSVQIISARYSNVTPNDSLVESTSLNKTSDVTERSINVNNSPRLSILETIEHLKQVKLEDSQINQKLTMSPVARLSIMDNSTEVLENYHYHEMPNSLRSTRKKFGMAFASLHNVSAQAAEDLNESINNSMHSFNDGMKDGEESKSSSPNILSLDGYQQKDDLCGKENQAPLYQSYIEFVKTDDCDHGSDNEVFEISDSNQLIDESIESDQSSENEYEDDSSSEFDEFIEDSGRKMNDKISEDLFGINPIENSSDDDEKETDVLCSVSRIDEQLFENLKFIVDDSEDRPHEIQEEMENIDDHLVITKRGVSLAPKENTAAIAHSSRKTIALTAEGKLSDSFQKHIDEELLQNELRNIDEHPVITKRGVSLAPQESSAVIAQSSRKTIAPTAEGKLSDSFQEHIDEELLQNELRNIDVHPVITKRGVSLAPQENTAVIAHSSRKTIAPTAEGKLSDSFQEHIDEELLQNELRNIDDHPVITKRGVSLAPQESTVVSAQSSRKTIALTAEGKLSDSFQEHIDEELLQNELRNIDDHPVITKRGVSLAPQESTAVSAQSSRKTIAPTAEGKLSDSFQEHIDEELLQNELRNIDDHPVITKRGVSLAPQENTAVTAHSSRKTIAPTAEGKLSDSFQEHIDEELLKNELRNIDVHPVFIKRGVSLAPQENTAVIAHSSRKTIAPTAEGKLSDSFQEHIDEELLQNELRNIDDHPVITKRGVSLAPQESTAVTAQNSRKTIAPTAEGKLSDSFQEHIDEELLQNELRNIDDHPVITKRGVSLAPQENTAATAQSSRKTIAPTAEGKLSDSFQEHIDEELLQNELRNIDVHPVITKRGVSLAPQESTVVSAQSSRKTIAPTAEGKLSDSFQEHIDKELLQNELRNIDDHPVITKRGVSLAPQENTAVTAQSSRKTIAPTAEGKLSDSFQEHIDEELLQNELRNIDVHPVITKRGVSLAPQESTVVSAQSSRKTIAPTAEGKLSDSFQEHIDEELLQNELRNIDDHPVITKRGVSLAPQENTAVTAQSSRKTIAPTAEGKLSDSFQEHIDEELLQNELRNIDVHPVITKRGVSLAPQESTVVSAQSSRKTIAPTAEGKLSDSFQEHIDEELFRKAILSQSLDVAVVKNEQLIEVNSTELNENNVHKIKESEEMEIDSVSKSSETGEILHLSFSAVLGNSTEKESVIDQEDLLPSTFEVVGKKRTRGVKVNYLEMATGSSAKISTPHRNVQSIEGTPRKSSRVAVLSKPAKSEIQLSPHGKELKFSSKFEKDPKENDLEELIGAKKMIHINKVVDIPKKELAKKNNRKKVAIEHLTDQPTTESGETAKELIKKQTKKDSKIAVDKVKKALDETIKTDKIEVQSEIKSRRGKKIHDEIEAQIRNGQIQTNQEETPIYGVLTGGTVTVSAVTFSVTEEQSVVIEEVGKPVRKGRVVAATKTKEIVSTDEFATPVKRGRKKAVSIETDAKIIEINSVATTNLSKETPKRGRKKTVKIVENELIHSEVALINEALTESIVDDNASETPRRGRRKLVKNVKKTDLIVTQREEVPAGELQIEVILAEQDPAIKDLCSIIPKRGRKETVKVETRSVVTKKKDIVVAELKQKEVTELDEYQIAENVAEKEPKMTDKLSTETPRRGRKKIVKNVETRSVVINKKDINETELKPQNLAVEPKIIEVEVAEKELASTEKLFLEKPFKGNEKTVNNGVTKSVATKTKDLVEVELQQKNVTVEDVKMEEQVAEQKSSTTNKLGRETPLRVRKKVVKPVISKKADETETEQKNEPIEAAEKPATVGRAAKKRKSELEMETSITTDLIPKRRLRGTAAKDVVETHQKKDDQEIEVKDVTIDTKTVETNIRKRKIKPAALEADINTIVKKSRAKATKKKNEELSADETMEVQKILVDNTESQPSKAKKVIVPTEVKRSTRRKN